MVKTCFALAESTPSAVLDPQETIDDQLHSFVDFNFESTYEESNKSGLLHLPEDFRGTIPTKQSLTPAELHSLNDLTVMKSGEEERPSEEDDTEYNSGDEVSLNFSVYYSLFRFVSDLGFVAMSSNPWSILL